MVKPGREDIKQYRDGALVPDPHGDPSRFWHGLGPLALTRPEERIAPLQHPRRPSSQPSESPRVVSNPRQTSLMSTMPSSLVPPTTGMYMAPDESINSAAAATPVSGDRVIGSRLTAHEIADPDRVRIPAVGDRLRHLAVGDDPERYTFGGVVDHHQRAVAGLLEQIGGGGQVRIAFDARDRGPHQIAHP